MYGTSLVTGWARVHGYPVGILANARGVLFSEESQKAAQFIQLANQIDTPLLFLHNTTGYMVGKEYEQGGIIKHGAMMINAVSNSKVPHISILMGASYGAGHYGMCGRAYDPRFLFAWPSAKSAVMGPQQLAGVLSIVARQAAASRGQEYNEEHDAAMRAMVEDQIEAESLPMFLSGMLYDDGIIDPGTPGRCSASACPPSTTDRSAAPGASASSGCDGHDHQPAGRQPGRDRPPGVPHLPRRWASARWRCYSDAGRAAPHTCGRRTRRCACPAPRPPTPTCAPTCWSPPRRAPARTRCTPATASCRRTRRSPVRCSTPG